MAGLGLMFAIIADAAQQRLLRYEPHVRSDVPGELSEFEADQNWPKVNLDLNETPLLAYGSDDALSAEAVARIAAIAPAAGDSALDPELAPLTVRQLAHDALALVNDPSLSDESRQIKFRQLVMRDFDLALIAKFAIGRHWRGASPEQRQAYVAAFTDHLLASYTGHLRNADLSAIDVVGTRGAGKRDVMVETRVLRNSGQPLTLIWRLRPREGQFRIIDIVAEGVSLALTKRQEFAAIIGAGGNDLDGLIRKLIAANT
tara:strand:- start:344 stop:1120 length:777 start_codon:yes stop_codon:yes gene_type:complete